MPEFLNDVFAPSTATRPQSADEGADADSTLAVPVVSRLADPLEVEANFQRLTERRAAGERAAIARHDAVIARAIAQAFSEYGRAFHKVATTKGSAVDHAVAVNLAVYCDEQVAEYTAMQTVCTNIARNAEADQ